MSKPKCIVCKKKLRLAQSIQYTCKCGKQTCHEHIVPQEHQCSYDFHVEVKNKLKKEMPVVQNDKVVYI